MTIEKVQIVGAGQMGSGIAQVTAQAGLAVHLADVDDSLLVGENEDLMPPKALIL